MSTYDDPAEVARVRAYQASQRARVANDRARLAALSGSRTARERLADAWSAVKRDPRYPEQSPSLAVPLNAYPASYPASY